MCTHMHVSTHTPSWPSQHHMAGNQKAATSSSLGRFALDRGIPHGVQVKTSEAGPAQLQDTHRFLKAFLRLPVEKALLRFVPSTPWSCPWERGHKCHRHPPIPFSEFHRPLTSKLQNACTARFAPVSLKIKSHPLPLVLVPQGI